jgi:thiol-disulfide isomerase/thioredoxin
MIRLKMRRLIYLLLLLSINTWGQEGKLTSIYVTLDEKSSGVDQWVYWFSCDSRGDCLIDSCYVSKDQKSIYMSGYLQDEYNNLSTLFFSQKGPDALRFYLLPGENAQHDLKTHKYENTPTTSDMFGLFMLQIETSWKKQELQKQSDSITDPILHKQLSDSINHYEYLLQQGNLRNMFKDAKAPFSCYMAFVMLNEFLSEEEIRDYITEMKNRFPGSRVIQLYPEQDNYTERETSGNVRWRKKQLNAQKYNIPLIADIPKSEKKTSIEFENIIPYKLGDTVDSLKEEGLNGELISLDSINTPFVLIDFWASWCTPCLKEFPRMKEVLEQYSDSLTIYAISLDNKETDWRRIIDSRKIGVFTHARTGGSDTPKGQRISKRFGIEFIPANFLLDKDIKIIAINLKGAGLKEKLDSLVK